MVSMAQSRLSCDIAGFWVVDVPVNNHIYTGITFGIMDHLCADAILGQIFKNNKRLVIEYDGY